MRKYFTGTTEKDAIGYKCGENMVFRLKLVADGSPLSCPLFKWSCSGDDGSVSEGVCPGGSGELTVVTSVSRPGFAHVVVTACGDDGNAIPDIDKFEGGAGAEIEKIRQGAPDPEGFDDFWTGCVKELDGVAPEIIEKKQVASPDINFDVYDMKIACAGKTPVSGFLSVPKNAAAEQYAALLTFRGYGVDGADIAVVKDRITFQLNAHGIENKREPEYYDRLRNNELKGFGFDRDENKRPETVYFKYMVLRGIQAVRFVKTMKEWNGKEIYLNGGSMGAFQPTSVAAHEPGITSLSIGIPWMCDLGGIIAGRLRGWRPEFDEGIRYYDTAAQASRISCPVEITAGLGDYVCPPSGVTVLYNNLKGKKSLTFIQNRTHPYVPPETVKYTVSSGM